MISGMNINLTASAVSAYIDSHLFILFLLASIAVIELILRTYQSTIRLKFISSQKGVTDEVEIENISIKYYSKKQRIVLTRSIIFLLAILISILYYDVKSFGFFAVALGAIIVAFKETIVSMFSYFTILRNYKIGDDIKVVGVRGEVLNIRPTYTTLLGKEEDGEYNGKITIIQNYQLIINPVERQEMKSHSYLMASISIPYDTEKYNIPFSDFIEKLKGFLDKMLPSRGMSNVGYYRSYAGMRYKLNYSYDKDARVIIHISFVSKPRRITDRKEKIVSFVETCKK